ncbi:carbonic anhydrase [Natrinema pallidum]|uniref:carbonic anhydrase n=1 Tax=Natrinema pallidum DSM 3751 TaxID=1227495 RepID=L9Z835_9EURY|nr:carbonic anhydrase [Natrinema pallidum]ELY82494.1 carbonic anhydrase [Natrinema pallidum DSM 3751]
MGTDRGILERLLAGNRRHVESLPDGYFADVQTGQHPSVVAVCCSDSRVAHEGMWGVDRPGTVFTPSNIGNQVWDDDGGNRIIDGGVLYPIHHTGTDAVAVVGHTGCGAVTAAYQVATGADPPGPRGVDKWVDMLIPVVEAALESDRIDREAADDTVINQLVEYNVGYQVRSLGDADAVPDRVDTYGFVYDFQGVYGDRPGRTYLVTVDGETAPDALAELVPNGYESAVESLLYGDGADD